MNRLWLAKPVPEFWTLKSLVELPKKYIVQSVNDLHPIGLIKVTRKLWTAMVTRRLIGVIKKRLQTNHCGGLANKGTGTALIQLLNLLEDMQEHGNAAVGEITAASMYFTSWDTEKAFDSVENHVQYTAWRRMGVPIDEAGHRQSICPVLLPHQEKPRKGGDGQSARHEPPCHNPQLGFSPERECTQ
jgi:hypothetical protein